MQNELQSLHTPGNRARGLANNRYMRLRKLRDQARALATTVVITPVTGLHYPNVCACEESRITVRGSCKIERCACDNTSMIVEWQAERALKPRGLVNESRAHVLVNTAAICARKLEE
ncbi:hypothetical protein Trydic_g7540 [Trypoxylus dichotomus]